MKLCLAVITALSLAFVTQASAALIDDFNRDDSADVGATSENGSLVWKEMSNTGVEHSSGDTVVQILDNRLYVGNSSLAGGSGVGGNGGAQLGPFDDNLILTFDMEFSSITSAPADFDRWGIEAQVQIRRPDGGAFSGSGLSAGTVAVGFYPNGNIHIRTRGDSATLDDVYFNAAGGMQAGIGSHETDPDSTFDMVGVHTIQLSLIGNNLDIYVDDLVSPLISYQIDSDVTALAENYIAFGKFLRTSSGNEARYDVAFDNVDIAVPEPASMYLFVMATIAAASAGGRRRIR